MESRELIKIIQEDGWVHVRTVGSHMQFKHPTKNEVVTVLHPKKDLSSGTLNRVLRQAKLKKGKKIDF